MSSPKKVTNNVTQILPNGWRRRIYLRTKGASAGRKDVVLISPDDFILRSNVEIERYAKTNKVKLDPKVYTVSLLAVGNIFKQEAGRLLAKPKTSISSPVSQNENKKEYTKAVSRRTSTSRASVLTEAAPSNVIRKSLAKEETPQPRKRGRPRKDQSLTLAKKIVRHSFSLRRKSAPPAKAESKSTKRRRSGDSGTGREEKRGKFEDNTTAFAAAGRQTRNSISAIEIPTLSPKNKKQRSVSPEKVAKQVDPEKKPEKAKQDSSKQFKGYGPITEGKQEALKIADALVAALLSEDTIGQGETDEDEELVEIAEQLESNKVDLEDQTAAPDAESTKSKQEEIDKTEVEQVLDNDKGQKEMEAAEDGGSETEVEDCEENCSNPRHSGSSAKGGAENADDYEVPMDDVEMSFQAPAEPLLKTDLPESEAPTEKSPSPSPPPPQIAEEVEVPAAEEPEEEEEEEGVEETKEGEKETREREETGFKVVNSKDLDKIDLNNFKFFVLPDNEDELPGDELLPENWSAANLSENQLIILPEGNKDLASAISKAVAARELEMQQLKKEAEESSSPTPDEDLDVSDDEEEKSEVVDTETLPENEASAEDVAKNVEVEPISGSCPSAEESAKEPAVVEPTVEEPAKEAAVEPEDSFLLSQSPYVLIYEHPSIGGDSWRLLLAAMVNSNESAQIGPVLTQKLLQRFPDADSILQCGDILGLPECEFVPNLPWLVCRLQKVARRLVDGAQVEDLSDEVGAYAVDVWRIFGQGKLDIVTKEFDLLAYLEWRQALQE